METLKLTFNDLKSQGIVCIRSCMSENRIADIRKYRAQLTQAKAMNFPVRELEAELKRAEKELYDIEKGEFSIEREAIEGFAYYNDAEYRRVVRVSEEQISFEPNRNSVEQGSCTPDEWLRWVRTATKIANEGEKRNVKIPNIEAMMKRAEIEHDIVKKELVDKGVAKDRKHIQ